MSARPHVVIVGSGFGGLAAAKALSRAPVGVTVIDLRNHHLFQPPVSQVATAGLSPADIIGSIRSMLRDQQNSRVLLDEVRRIDREARMVHMRDNCPLYYDWLIVATGARHSYFGMDAWAPQIAVSLADTSKPAPGCHRSPSSSGAPHRRLRI